MQIYRLLVPNVILTTNFAEWAPIWSKTDILLELSKEAHVFISKRAISHVYYQEYASIQENVMIQRFLAVKSYFTLFET